MNGSVVVSRERRRADSTGGYPKERHAGALAATAWLEARGLRAPGKVWDVAIALDVVGHAASPTVTSATDSRFHIAIASGEWGFFFCHRGKVSWIRVTDVPFVNERDEYDLLARTPPLRELGALVRELETRFRLTFRRDQASIRTTVPDAEAAIRGWLVAVV